MRVLHITNMYPTPERKNFGIFVKTQIDSLSARGIDNDIVRVNGYVSKWKYLTSRGNVRRALANARYDIIHVHYGLTALAIVGIKACPVVISYCGTDLMHPLQRKISKGLAFTANRHVVESRSLKTSLGKESAVVIPSGVDLNIFSPMSREEARRKLGYTVRGPIVVFVASPENRIKNFELARKVVDNVKTTVPQLQFIVVQGKSHQEVALHLNAADVLLLTSHWEGSPNVVKEALACSLPIVSTDVGDVRERLEGVQYSYVEQASVERLAVRVQELVQNPVRSNGHEKVGEVSLERIAERLESLYMNMCS